MRKMRLGFAAFVNEAIKDRRYKNQLTRSTNPELTRALYNPTRSVHAVDELEKKVHAEYRTELKSMAKYDHFQAWKAKDVDHLQTKARDVIGEMRTRAPRLVSLFCVITRPADSRSKRDKDANDSRWIAIMAILLYTFKP